MDFSANDNGPPPDAVRPPVVSPERFDYGLLEETSHRPWPIPADPWLMTQTWNDLLFAHWPVDPAHVRSLVPAALPLDLFDGRAWIGIVPFHMTNVAPRGLPSLPGISAFAEANVRTYVTIADKPGVYFFSLDAASTLAVAAARALFNLPYFSAAMDVRTSERVDYSTRRINRDRPADFVGRYWPTGLAVAPAPGTLEYFLTERYCLYNVDRRGRVGRLDIHHRPWPLQPAAAEIAINTMAEAAGLHLPDTPPLLHFAKRQDMVAWGMRRV